LRVATSRCGRLLGEVAGGLRADWGRSRSVLVAFGSPSMGLGEILGQEGLRVEDLFQYTVNLVGFQGVETVRTEEAVMIGLALLNFTCKD
ncbi:MAG: putative RNA uridine N3 methyltransferase, partial [Candidatus Bathyarchaeia archaeon]